MRLIDAEEMIKRLQEWNTKDAMDTALFNFALHRILEQPTAYDVDEVVKQIEDVREKECVACTDTDCGYCKYSKECWDGEMGDKLALDKAIEIAKGGGVE